MCSILPRRIEAAERAWPFVELLDSRICDGADGIGAEEARINKLWSTDRWRNERQARGQALIKASQMASLDGGGDTSSFAKEGGRQYWTEAKFPAGADGTAKKAQGHVFDDTRPVASQICWPLTQQRMAIGDAKTRRAASNLGFVLHMPKYFAATTIRFAAGLPVIPRCHEIRRARSDTYPTGICLAPITTDSRIKD